MAMTTISSREFNQDIGRAKRAADVGPVVITDRGEPAYVLLRHDAYRHLVVNKPGIREQLAMPGVEDIDFEPVRLQGPLFRAADLG